MAIYQIDRLQCKRELIMMLIQGHTLREMAEFVARQGEQCTKSSIDRYLKQKFIDGHIFKDGSIELIEKEGERVKVTRFPPDGIDGSQVEVSLLYHYPNISQ